MTQITSISISGMTCTACEKMIAKRLQKIEGVQEIVASSNRGDVLITASRPITNDEVIVALDGTHYKVINNS
jgi:copper chaperone CopZ